MKAEQFLLSNGVYPSLKGYRYFLRAIELVIDNEQSSMTKVIYPSIAATFDVTGSKVERAIRHLISKIPYKAFQDIGIKRLTKPTNSELIYLFAELEKNKVNIGGKLWKI